jgi:hypothetical protein
MERDGEGELQAGQQHCIEGFEHDDHLTPDTHSILVPTIAEG